MIIHALCRQLRVPQETLAEIMGFPNENLTGWALAGVPLTYHYDFSILEVMVQRMEMLGLKVEETLRRPLANFDGKTVLDLLIQEGPGSRRFRSACAEIYEVAELNLVAMRGEDEVSRSRERMNALLEQSLQRPQSVPVPDIQPVAVPMRRA